MRNTLLFLLTALLCSGANAETSYAKPGAPTDATLKGGLQVQIQSPSADFVANSGETTVEVDGIASAIGGVQYLDMIFVMDTSQSLPPNSIKNAKS